jgi:hypothetical protein
MAGLGSSAAFDGQHASQDMHSLALVCSDHAPLTRMKTTVVAQNGYCMNFWLCGMVVPHCTAWCTMRTHASFSVQVVEIFAAGPHRQDG